MQLSDKHEGTTTKAFAGLRVLDFSTTIAGPHCARMLADMGAEVIKIETDGGETMRTRPPLRKGCSTVFGQLNVGKKSVVLDLKSEDGREAVRRLVATSDILVENFRPGVMRRLRLDYDSLRPVNPKLIYCSISGYGQTGPSAELPAYAPVIHAASGYDMAHLAYQPGRSRPDYCGIYHADVVTGTYGFGAIASALYQRTVTALGQHIDVSMLESMLTLTVIELQSSQFAVKPPPRPMFGPTETANGYVMITVASEKTFQGLMGVIGRPEWIADPRFATYAARRENWADMMDGVEAWSRQLSTDECLVGLSAAGVPASAYRTITEALADPQLAHRQALSAVQDEGGSFRVLNLPFRMTGADTTPGERMAALGEHTRELRNEVGLADDAPIPSGKTSVQG
ncbi:carnitine dehydratase [Bradyrhizobium sp. LTSP849]|jgi:CoA:oxalate CoA-transferase|uniref:CaiB/BaiF CoA transferase family protein n=1 Tax=unclassified Bradyrhizobium TaxID=2631580 RepID=UPI0005D173A4|nr:MULTISPECIES: CoA transferase [unclassified Bradyrhizobium]KJC33299.1 carnitine dehydratase [Bradyrhizobium sp. LTSP857]KJC54225.1 carnitine dehydratase [Bradyrhizobium sp. LTSP849]